MTVLRNAIVVGVGPERAWQALARLEALSDYDPGIAESRILDGAAEGPGAARHCALTGGGWFRERVTVWEPGRALELTLYECTLPVKRLRHHYTLRAEGTGTRIEQVQEYELLWGPLGALMDAVYVRRTWNAGIQRFFAGFKAHVERLV